MYVFVLLLFVVVLVEYNGIIGCGDLINVICMLYLFLKVELFLKWEDVEFKD